MSIEYLPIVDCNGCVIGSAPRFLCHDGTSMLLHPVVHLHIVKPNGDILLQKRSATKKIQPGKWDSCVGGHVDADETVEQALRREAMEEIGFEATGARFLTRYEFQSEIERELINVFIIEVDANFAISVSNDEVDEVKFVSRHTILNPDFEHQFTPNFLSEYKTVLSHEL